jgi:hypothetical protein
MSTDGYQQNILIWFFLFYHLFHWKLLWKIFYANFVSKQQLMKYFPSALPLGFFFYSFSQPAFVSKHFQVQTKL